MKVYLSFRQLSLCTASMDIRGWWLFFCLRISFLPFTFPTSLVLFMASLPVSNEPLSCRAELSPEHLIQWNHSEALIWSLEFNLSFLVRQINLFLRAIWSVYSTYTVAEIHHKFEFTLQIDSVFSFATYSNIKI